MSSETPSSESASSDDSIRVTTTSETPVVVTLAVEVDVARVERSTEAAYRELAKRAQLPGFRRGKVPRSVLERRFGPAIAEQLEGTLVADTLAEAIELAGVTPVTEPSIDAETPSPGAPFRYSARVEVKPEIELPDLSGLPAKQPPVEVGDEEVESELESLRQRAAPVLEDSAETEVADGHIVAVDFVGRIDGKPFEGGTGRGVDVEVGAGRFIPGFEDGLLGARAGEDREIAVRFPDEYGNEELAGKDATFAAHILSVKRRQVAELDDEFAKDMGDFESLEALRLRIRSDLLESRDHAAKQVLHRTLVDSLIERTSFEVPAGMIQRSLESQLGAARRRLEGQVPAHELEHQMARWAEEWRTGAEREVRQRLLLEAVARARELEVEDAEVEARFEEMAQAQGIDPAQLRKAADDGLREGIRGQMLEEQALALLAGEAKVEETTDT